MSKYWFKRKRYGWGWTPSTWQGWLSVLVFVIIIMGASLMLINETGQPTQNDLNVFLIIFAIALFQIILISYKKGPKPKWRWGKKPTDNKEEDF